MTRVKICGLSTPEAVDAAVAAGADYIGFVFAPSRRQVSLAQAADLARRVSGPTQTVGVFVSPSLAELQEAIKAVPLDLVQIHGDFEESLLAQLPVPAIRALQVTRGSEGSLDTLADFLLFDAPVAGSGQRFDWQVLEKKSISKPFFVAGGLTVDNLAEAKSLFTPYAVDVSSGVETEGSKDLTKIKEFIERAKA